MTRSPLLVVPLLLGLAGLAWADDWPQFLGPARDGHSRETGLLDTWPKSGPPVLWHKDVGEGYSGVAIAGERVIFFHRPANEEVVHCLDAATGKVLWRQAQPTEYQDALGKGNGPRATPVIDGNRVVTLGAAGHLTCLDLSSGRKLWGRALLSDYRVPPSYFGVGTSPVVEQGLVLVNVGGKGAGIVAFAIDSGKEVWRATDDGASYASPVVCTIDGARRAVFFTRNGPVVLDPQTGAVTFRSRWRARYDASVNAATPLIIGELAFFSTSYETGALLLRLKKDGADEVWSDANVMANHYNTCVYHDGYLYGFDGRQESGPSFRCVELRSRRVAWTQPPERLGNGAMILANGRLIVMTEKGELLLVEAAPRGYRELARAPVLQGPVRAQIALADGRLYARDEHKLVCFNLKK
jgi:outer membrane protein assembly factor BamB